MLEVPKARMAAECRLHWPLQGAFWGMGKGIKLEIQVGRSSLIRTTVTPARQTLWEGARSAEWRAGGRGPDVPAGLEFGKACVEGADSWPVSQRELVEEEMLIRVAFAPERSSTKAVDMETEENK